MHARMPCAFHLMKKFLERKLRQAIQTVRSSKRSLTAIAKLFSRREVLRTIFTSFMAIIAAMAVFFLAVFVSPHLALMAAFTAMISVLCLRTGKCREIVIASTDLLRCGLKEPIDNFAVIFLFCLGFMYVVEELGGIKVPEHVVFTLGDVQFTARTLVLLVLSVFSAVIASTRETSSCYHEFVRLIAGVSRLLLVLVVLVLGLTSVGLIGGNLKLIMMSGLLILILWFLALGLKSSEVLRNQRRRRAKVANISSGT